MNKLLFSFDDLPLLPLLKEGLACSLGEIEHRLFPDGEMYIRIVSDVTNKHCIVLTNLVSPNAQYLPLLFLASTLKELGAASVGIVAPYLAYMRQDIRFKEGEVITSKIFAQGLSEAFDWLVTIDPHLHRYHSLDEIYAIPSAVLQGAPLLAEWLSTIDKVLLVGPDAESEQWVSSIANIAHHPFVIGEKIRKGDRQVEVMLPNISAYTDYEVVIIDDVISSGQTLLKCIKAIQQQGINNISCAAVHGLFADNSDTLLMQSGIHHLITTNTIPHRSNNIDTSTLLIKAILQFIPA